MSKLIINEPCDLPSIKTNKQNKITYKFSKDPEILNKYYKMRANSFISTWKLKKFSYHEEPYDRLSYILVAMNDKECIAGARLIPSPKEKRLNLTFEVDGFNVIEAFPNLNLQNKSYGEISRLAVAPDYSKTDVGQNILRMIGLKGKDLGLDYFIVVCPKTSGRFVRKTFNNFGFKATIHPEVKFPDYLPTYENIKMDLMVIEINKGHKKII